MFTRPSKIIRHKKEVKTLEEVEKYFPGFLAFTDSIEQQIPRPKYNRRRHPYYSDKKKRLTIKIQLMVNERYILYKLGHKKERRKHD